MTSTIWFRAAAVLLLIFALGHTVGFLRFVPPSTEGRAVLDAMRSVHFSVGRSSFSYGGFYVGFGLYVTAYLLFSAVLAWQLGGFVTTAPAVVRPIGALLVFVQIVGLVLSWMYFSAAPAAFSALVTLCLGVGTWLAGTAPR